MLLPTPLVYVLVIYPTLIPNIVYYLQSLLVAIHRHFHLLISIVCCLPHHFLKGRNSTDVAKTMQDMTNTSFSIKKVRRAVRGTGKKAVTKQKWLFFPRNKVVGGWTLQRHTKTGQWGTGNGLFGQMRPKSIIWNQMGKKWVWKMPGGG